MYNQYHDFLLSLENTAKLRKLPDYHSKQSVINFASNDYLQLATHPKVINAAIQSLENFGCGATGSRLLSGNYELIEAFEAQIAKDKKTEAALIYPSGFQANLSVLGALLDPKILNTKALVFFDKRNHASLYQALNLHQLTPIRYRHLDMNHLSDLLMQHRVSSAPKFIVSETVFGMDGSHVELQQLIELAQQHQAFLYLDEAHATGLFGKNGYGLSTSFDLSAIPHLIMGSFSKALGCQGAYIACAKTIASYLTNKSSGFIYSTACSPMIIGAAYQAWKLLPSFEAVRTKIFALSHKLNQALNDKGMAHPQATTHIQPMMIAAHQDVREQQAWFLSQGILCSAIRPPTVTHARLRFALNASILADDVDHLIELIHAC